MSEVAGYTFQNPDRDIGRFEVVHTNQVQEATLEFAGTVRQIITRALVKQLGEHITGEQRADIIASNDDAATLAKQWTSITESTGKDGKPLFVHARIPSQFAERSWFPVGIGEAKYADGRFLPERQADPSPESSANLADISEIYVLPVMPGSERSLQNKGIGSAITLTMLDSYPRDMATVVDEDPELNPRSVSLLQRSGFRAVQERPDAFFGIHTTLVRYAGPACGELIETIEARQPWVREREPIEAAPELDI